MEQKEQKILFFKRPQLLIKIIHKNFDLYRPVSPGFIGKGRFSRFRDAEQKVQIIAVHRDPIRMIHKILIFINMQTCGLFFGNGRFSCFGKSAKIVVFKRIKHPIRMIQKILICDDGQTCSLVFVKSRSNRIRDTVQKVQIIVYKDRSIRLE